MTLYVDADAFLALLKEQDRHKRAAEIFFQKHQGQRLTTSTITCLEIWFYLYRNGAGEKALSALRAVNEICTIFDFSFADLQAGALLASQCQLSPADALHATLALSCEGIVSSDKAFDRVVGLKRVDFTR